MASAPDRGLSGTATLATAAERESGYPVFGSVTGPHAEQRADIHYAAQSAPYLCLGHGEAG